MAIPKFAAQAIRKAAERSGSRCMSSAALVTRSVATLKPAGLDKSMDIVSDFYLKDPTDPQWKDDAGYKWWLDFMNKYYPAGDKADALNVYGPSNAATVVQVLKQCGDDVTRENVMEQAANLQQFRGADVVARDRDQHQSDRLRAGQAGANGPL